MIHAGPIPHIVVNDGARAIAFYETAFGATLLERNLAEDGRRVMHAHLKLGDGALFLNDEFPEFGAGGLAPARDGRTSCVLHVQAEDADAVWARALDAGAEVVMPLENQFWGMRYGQVRDPFGHVWSIGGPVLEG